MELSVWQIVNITRQIKQPSFALLQTNMICISNKISTKTKTKQKQTKTKQSIALERHLMTVIYYLKHKFLDIPSLIIAKLLSKWGILKGNFMLFINNLKDLKHRWKAIMKVLFNIQKPRERNGCVIYMPYYSLLICIILFMWTLQDILWGKNHMVYKR